MGLDFPGSLLRVVTGNNAMATRTTITPSKRMALCLDIFPQRKIIYRHYLNMIVSRKNALWVGLDLYPGFYVDGIYAYCTRFLEIIPFATDITVVRDAYRHATQELYP